MNHDRFNEIQSLISQGVSMRKACRGEGERSAFKRHRSRLGMVSPSPVVVKNYNQAPVPLIEDRPEREVVDHEKSTAQMVFDVKNVSYTSALKGEPVSKKYLLDLYKLERQLEAQEKTFAPSDYRNILAELFDMDKAEEEKEGYEDKIKESIKGDENGNIGS